MEHRRTDRRYERRLDIAITYDGTTLKTQTRNISLGGVFIETDAALPFGMRVAIQFHVPTQSEVVEVDGQVRWSSSKRASCAASVFASKGCGRATCGRSTSCSRRR